MENKIIKLPFCVKRPVLALGAQTKNTLCFAHGDSAFLSPVHNDLDDPVDLSGFERRARHFLKRSPRVVAADLHPEYSSSRFVALCPGSYKLAAIQHHHAHIASCMVDNGLKNQKVIGVAFDGTGLGNDGTFWGAEFFICDYKDFVRFACVKPVPLPAGEKAIREPWRLTAAWLDAAYGEKFLELDLEFTRNLNKKKWRVLKKMQECGFNSPLSNSAGRLFDAAACLITREKQAHFEAELAIKLEKLAGKFAFEKNMARCYNFTVSKDGMCSVIDPRPIFKGIVRDLIDKEHKERIAYRFHATVAGMISAICLKARRKTGLNKIILSGGVFQNRIIADKSLGLLSKEGFRVFMHKKISCNDSGISLGQMAVGNFREGR